MYMKFQAFSFAIFLVITNLNAVNAQFQTLTFSDRTSFLDLAFSDLSYSEDREREDSGPFSASLGEVFGLPQFDPSLGPLVQVNVRLLIGASAGIPVDPGEIDFGVSPRGGSFDAGGGSVNVSATTAIVLSLGTSTPVSISDTAIGSHSGSIGSGLRDPITDIFNSSESTLFFSESQNVTFTSPNDLSLFEGLGTVNFQSSFDATGSVTVTDPGPHFGIDRPFAAATAEITYTFGEAVPEPSSGILMLLGAFGSLLMRRRIS